MVAHVLNAPDETAAESVAVNRVEVVPSQIVVPHVVPEDVVNGREHRGGDRSDGLLAASPGLDAVQLGTQVGILALDRRPCALNEQGLEPVRTLARDCCFRWSEILIRSSHVLGSSPRPARGIRGRRLYGSGDWLDGDSLGGGEARVCYRDLRKEGRGR